MTREQEIRIESECGWELFEAHTTEVQKHWSYMRDKPGDKVVFIEMNNGAKYSVCAGPITDWKNFRDYRNMLQYLKSL